MNGLHDMGGQHGYGPVLPEKDEPIFHAEWEARALALTLAMGAHGKWSIDMSRFARECLSPQMLVNETYYARWIAALTDLMLAHALLSEAELASGMTETVATPPLKAADVAGVLSRGGPTERDAIHPPKFAPGDRVQTRNFNPEGHTRLPRYARGKPGEVVLYHGAHVFADESAKGIGAGAEPLYAVRFSARDLWGDAANPRDTVTLDLWEPYLERP